VAGYGGGVFSIDQLNTVQYLPPDKIHYASAERLAPTDAAGLAALNVDAVVVGAGAKLNRAEKEFLTRGFSLVMRYPRDYDVYLRRGAQPHALDTRPTSL
jgi:hypothetical protein